MNRHDFVVRADARFLVTQGLGDGQLMLSMPRPSMPLTAVVQLFSVPANFEYWVGGDRGPQ